MKNNSSSLKLPPNLLTLKENLDKIESSIQSIIKSDVVHTGTFRTALALVSDKNRRKLLGSMLSDLSTKLSTQEKAPQSDAKSHALRNTYTALRRYREHLKAALQEERKRRISAFIATLHQHIKADANGSKTTPGIIKLKAQLQEQLQNVVTIARDSVDLLTLARNIGNALQEKPSLSEDDEKRLILFKAIWKQQRTRPKEMTLYQSEHRSGDEDTKAVRLYDDGIFSFDDLWRDASLEKNTDNARSRLMTQENVRQLAQDNFKLASLWISPAEHDSTLVDGNPTPHISENVHPNFAYFFLFSSLIKCTPAHFYTRSFEQTSARNNSCGFHSTAQILACMKLISPEQMLRAVKAQLGEHIKKQLSDAIGITRNMSPKKLDSFLRTLSESKKEPPALVMALKGIVSLEIAVKEKSPSLLDWHVTSLHEKLNESKPSKKEEHFTHLATEFNNLCDALMAKASYDYCNAPAGATFDISPADLATITVKDHSQEVKVTFQISAHSNMNDIRETIARTINKPANDFHVIIPEELAETAEPESLFSFMPIMNLSFTLVDSPEKEHGLAREQQRQQATDERTAADKTQQAEDSEKIKVEKAAVDSETQPAENSGTLAVAPTAQHTSKAAKPNTPSKPFLGDLPFATIASFTIMAACVPGGILSIINLTDTGGIILGVCLLVLAAATAIAGTYSAVQWGAKNRLFKSSQAEKVPTVNAHPEKK